MTFIIGGLICLYLWKKEKDKFYFWFIWVALILIVNHILGFYIKKYLSLRERTNSGYFFIIFDFILLGVIIWALFKDYNKKNKGQMLIDRKKWLDFLSEVKKGSNAVLVGMVIERAGKFLILEWKPLNDLSKNGIFDFPHSYAEISENSYTTKIAKQGLKEATNLALIKLIEYLGVLSYKSDPDDLVKLVCYLAHASPGEIKLDTTKYKNYYWVEIGDEIFNTLNASMRAILERAQEYLKKNTQK